MSASPWDPQPFDFGDAAIVETPDTGIQRLFFLEGAPGDEGLSSFGRLFSAEVHPGAIDAGQSGMDKDLQAIFSDTPALQAVARAAAPYLNLDLPGESDSAP